LEFNKLKIKRKRRSRINLLKNVNRQKLVRDWCKLLRAVLRVFARRNKKPEELT
tara:strand:- start:160 stop:321 length:162 start_codon:yes stop_codon:yes gene_type:complete